MQFMHNLLFLISNLPFQPSGKTSFLSISTRNSNIKGGKGLEREWREAGPRSGTEGAEHEGAVCDQGIILCATLHNPCDICQTQPSYFPTLRNTGSLCVKGKIINLCIF